MQRCKSRTKAYKFPRSMLGWKQGRGGGQPLTRQAKNQNHVGLKWVERTLSSRLINMMAKCLLRSLPVAIVDSLWPAHPNLSTSVIRSTPWQDMHKICIFSIPSHLCKLMPSFSGSRTIGSLFTWYDMWALPFLCEEEELLSLLYLFQFLQRI